MARPAVAYCTAAALAAAMACLFAESHGHINRADPDVSGARWRLQLSILVAAAALALLALLAGRRAGWLLLPGLLGLVHLFDVLEGYQRFGMDAEVGLSLALLGSAHLVLAALGAWFMARRPATRPWAAWVPLAFLAAWALPFALVGASFVGDLDAQARDIEASWTNEHADPPPAFWAVAVAVLAAVAWARRRR